MKRDDRNFEQRFLDLISGQSPSPLSALARLGLRSCSWGYGAAIHLRNAMFDLGLRGCHSAPAPVISVGNLTTGGTGKTPTVALLVDLLKESGHQPGIISRGYRELNEGGNDEARVLELLCPNTPHIQNRDRVAAATEVSRAHDCNIIIADDAFQHRRLQRDLDIVLIDALNPWGYEAVLPRGLLREPVSGLRRADIIALTRADLLDEASKSAIWSRARRWNPAAPRVEITFEPSRLIGIDGAPAEPNFDGKSTLAFCGIGNPEGFRETLRVAGIEPLELAEYPDHYHYQPDDLQKLTQQAEQLSAQRLVTTLKDLVKLPSEWVGSIPVFALDIRARLVVGEDDVTKALESIMRRQTQ